MASTAQHTSNSTPPILSLQAARVNAASVFSSPPADHPRCAISFMTRSAKITRAPDRDGGRRLLRSKLGREGISDREARAAAAGRGRVGIGDLERGADQVVDEIDLGAFHVAQRDRVDEHGRAVARDHEIVWRLALLHVEPVLEPGAAAALDADAEHGAGGLGGENLADASRCPLTYGDGRPPWCAPLALSRRLVRIRGVDR